MSTPPLTMSKPQSTLSSLRPLLSLFLLLATSTTRSCQASFLKEPKIEWTHRLPGSGTLSGRGLRKGNEVLLTGDGDGKTLFVTADDGSLHFIDTEDLRNSITFEPDTTAGTYTESSTGVTLVRNPTSGAVEYAVYAVVDVPVRAGVLYDDVEFDSSQTSTVSRLLAVNLDGSLRWSVPLNGAVVGKPVVGGEDNDMLYVVHNVPNLDDDGDDDDDDGNSKESPTVGKVSVVLMRGAQPTVTASLSPSNRNGPLGPPAGTTVTMDGSQRDVVVVSEAWNNGYLSKTDNVGGNVYMLRPSALFDEFEGQGNDAYELRLISDWSLPSVTRPALKSDVTELFVAATAASLGGWNKLSGVVAGEEEGVVPSWDISLEPSKGNASQPLLVAPILSSDETVLYQAGASTEIYCIDTKTGDVLWKEDGALRSSIIAEPRLVESFKDEPKLYVIEGMKGKVRQHDALTGAVDWAFDCHAVSGIPCNDAVEADFSVSPSGNMLYYGDIFGKIVALKIADFSSTTLAPSKEDTIPPSTEGGDPEELPTPAKTQSPTFAPVDLVVPVPDQSTEPPQDVEFESETGSGTVVNPGDTSDTELDANAAASSGGGGSDSFFASQMMIILVAVCGGLAVAIIVVLVAQKVRNGKPAEITKDTELKLDGDDGNGLTSGQDDYEEACRRDEEETLREIVTTPEKSGPAKRCSKKQKRQSPATPVTLASTPVTLASTPVTLASIEESPGECEVSFVSDDATPAGTPTRTPARNLEKSFDVSVGVKDAGKNQGVSLLGNVSTPKKVDTVSAPKETTQDNSVSGTETMANLSMCSASSVPHDLQSVEVVANAGSVKSQQSARRAKSPDSFPDPLDYNTNDLMSVDGSLYLDDDSLFQGKAEVASVASLAQYSVASSTRDDVSQLTGGYSVEDGEMRFISTNGAAPGAHYLQPPRQASPMLKSNLSPEVAEYLRRNQASMSPIPMTQTSPRSTSSPISPLSDAGKSPTVDTSSLARAGSSVRRGGSFGRRQSGSRESSPVDHTEAPSGSRSDSPPPQPPVETEAEPADAWGSFLSELAKAESDFFNPSFKKNNNKKKAKQEQERAQSPPPPPPPSYSPPDSPNEGPPPPPPDPPTRRRRQV